LNAHALNKNCVVEQFTGDLSFLCRSRWRRCEQRNTRWQVQLEWQATSKHRDNTQWEELRLKSDAVWSLNFLYRFVSTYEPPVNLAILVSPEVDIKLVCDGRKPKAGQECIVWMMQVLAVELSTKLDDSRYCLLVFYFTFR
jgi:hypothetical protein